MKLVAVKINGEALPEGDYQLTAKKLVLGGLPGGEFTLEIETNIKHTGVDHFGLKNLLSFSS